MALTITISAQTGQAEQVLQQFSATVARTMGQVDVRMQESTRRTEQSIGRMASSFERVQRQLQSMAGATNQFASINQAIQQFGQFASPVLTQVARQVSTVGLQTGVMAEAMRFAARETQRTSGLMSQAFGALRTSSVAAFAGITGGVVLLQRLWRSFLDNALAMDQTRLSLEAVTGSQMRARQEMAFLNQLADRTGTALDVLAQQWTGLFAAANPVPGRLQAARAAFEAVVEVAPRLGRTSAQIGLALFGLQQLVGGVTVQLDELQRQIGDQLPGVMPALARELGVGQQEIRKLASEGKLLVDETLPALARAIRSLADTNGPVQTATAEFSRMGTAWTRLMDTLAQVGVLSLVTRSLQGITAAINVLRAAIEAFRGLAPEEGLQRGIEALQRQIELERRLIESRLARGIPREVAEAPLRNLERQLAEMEARLQALQARPEEAAPPPDTRTAERQAAAIAAARQKALVQLRTNQLQLEAAHLAQLQALQEQALEADYRQAIESTQRTKADQEAIERAFQIRRLDLARETAFAEAELARRTAIAVRDARLAALAAEEREQQAILADPQATADAQRAANERLAALAVERQTIALEANAAIQKAETQRIEAQIAFERGLTGVISEETQKRLVLYSTAAQRAISTTVQQLEQGKRFIREQIRTEAITRQQGQAQIAALNESIFALEKARIERESQQRIEAAQGDAEEIKLIQIQTQQELGELATRHLTEMQELSRDEAEAYKTFVKDTQRETSNFIVNLLNILVDKTGSFRDFFKAILESLRQTFFRFIADMIAFAIARPIVVPIIATVVGGLASAIAPSLAQAMLQSLGLGGQAGLGIGTILQGAGVIGNLTSLFGPNSLLSQAVFGLVDILNAAANSIATFFGSTAFPAGFVGPLPAGAAQISSLGFFGGLAGIGGGIFAALQATTREGMAFGAAGAAAGLTASLAALGFLPSVLGPIGVALSALLPLLGGLFRPRGPGAFLGTPTLAPGAGITVTPEGQLAFTGALDVSARGRGGVDVGAIRQTLLDSLTQAIRSVLDLINAVAVDPSALHGVTQQALEQTLNDIIRINSANRNRLAQEISDQTFLAQTQMVAGLLGPVTDALAQVTALPIEEQIGRLPQATQGLVALLQGLEQAFQKLSESANSDVQRRLPQLRDQINAFHARIVSLTIDSIRRAFEQEAAAGIELAAALPQAVAALDPFLTQISALSQLAQPLLTQLQADIRQGLPPARAAEDIAAEIDRLLIELEAQQGAQAIATATQIRSLALELRQLGEETNNLLLQMQAQTTLEQLVPIVESQVQFLVDEQEAMRRQTEALEAIRQAFEEPIPVVVIPEGQQRGGVVGAQHGGLIPALLEPGEVVFPGPLSATTLDALARVNRTFPRFQVGGVGSGDHVPAFLPAGSFVLNRQASAQIGRGFQHGGVVSAAGPNEPQPVMVHNVFDLRGTVFRSREDIRELVQGIEDLLRRQGYSLYRRR